MLLTHRLASPGRFLQLIPARTIKAHHPHPQRHVNAGAKQWPPGGDTWVRNDHRVDEVKKAVRSNDGPGEQWDTRRSENANRREGNGNSRFQKSA